MVVSSPEGPTNVTLKVSAAATSRTPRRAGRAPLLPPMPPPAGGRAGPAPWMRAGAAAAAPGAAVRDLSKGWRPAGCCAGRLRARVQFDATMVQTLPKEMSRHLGLGFYTQGLTAAAHETPFAPSLRSSHACLC